MTQLLIIQSHCYAISKQGLSNIRETNVLIENVFGLSDHKT